jgi:putative phage-type endonuclease
MTPFGLWQQKLMGTEREKSSAMQRGIDLEASARVWFNQEMYATTIPDVKISSRRDWMLASADGWDEHKRILVEIKCPGKADHDTALKGEIPEKYIPQLQHQMEVYCVNSMFYVSYDGYKGKIIEIFRNDSYVKEMLDKELAFLECVECVVAPPMTDRDCMVRQDHDFVATAREWASLSKQLKELEAKEDMARKRLIALADKENVQGAGVKVTRNFRKGAIQYDKIDAIKGMDLEPYRKPAIECWRITVNG